jgi:hypothetical protein
VIPNRWLVFSRISFALFLLLALLPFDAFFRVASYRDLDVASVTAMIIVVFFVAPLPLSLTLSQVRFQKGDKFTYA